MPTNKTPRGRLELAVLDAKNLVTGARVELELAMERIIAPDADEVLATMELTEAVNQLVAHERTLAVAEERLAVHDRGALS